jgi:hypothetical protein
MLERSISPRANIRSVANRDGGVLLDIERGQMLSANPMGAWIWQMIEAGKSRTEIIRAIGDECGVDTGVVARDVDEFLTSLRSHHLVSE